MYDISKMQTIKSEHELSKRLFQLGWTATERLPKCNVYYGGKGKTLRRVGITVFHPQKGPCECTHYVLID